MAPMPVVAPSSWVTPADTFAVGERVRYWSVTALKWVDDQVKAINLGPSGVITSYDLNCKALACMSRIRRASTFVVAFEEGKGCSKKSAKGKAAARKKSKRAHVAPAKAVVATAAQKPAAVCKSPDKVETKARWLAKRRQMRQGAAKDVAISSVSPSCVRSNEDASASRTSHTRSRSRSRTKSSGAVAASAGAAAVSAAVSDNKKKIKASNGFQVGDQVDYFSESKSRWVATVVKNRLVLKDNTVIYDLSCKLSVAAKRIRSSQAAPDGRFQYYSHAAKRWLTLPARVDSSCSPEQCQVDPYL